jgi:formylglycine-generating enzyme required for sulfatase activity
VCNAASCVSGCYVGGVFYGAGAPNPTNACQSCQPATTTTAFSNVRDGTSCGSTTASCFSGACQAPPSCSAPGAGTTNCGASSQSCCASLEVAGGTFSRTYGPANDGGLADPAQVSGFRLDKYDVTVGRFRTFVTAWNNGSGWTPPAGSGKHAHLNGGSGLANSAAPGTFEPGWSTANDSNIAPTASNLSATNCNYSTWTPTAGSQENLPADCINWYEAYAFCIWDGGFLPSEAEWEYAAAGGSQQRLYPWGSTDPGTASQYAIYGGEDTYYCYYPSGTLAPCSGLASIAPVGTPALGAGLYGQLDLAGEMWQWALDWQASFAGPCIDCADTSPSYYAVMRGGYFSESTGYIQAEPRYSDSPTSRASYELGGPHGFRCARTP